MAVELNMPALSPTMDKGTLARWLVAVGDVVKPHDALAEVETDKATMEIEAREHGRIASLVVAEGTDDVPVGTLIALLEATDEGAPDQKPKKAASDFVAPVEAVASSAAIPATSPRHDFVPRARGDAGAHISPLAERLAAALYVDLEDVAGTGPRGKIIKADLRLAPMLGPIVPARDEPVAAASGTAPVPAGVPVEMMRLGGVRSGIAMGRTESQQAVPHFHITARCNLDPLLRLRAELNDSLAGRGIRLSVSDMLVKALALALSEVGGAGGHSSGDALHRFGRVDVAMAVTTEGGVAMPVLKEAAALSLSAIATIREALTQRARDGALAHEDYAGRTATISDLGMFSIDEMVAVIEPPQVLILGIGAGRLQPWHVDGEIKLATIMAATGSFDRRAIDGIMAARLMQRFRHLVEAPLDLCA